MATKSQRLEKVVPQAVPAVAAQPQSSTNAGSLDDLLGGEVSAKPKKSQMPDVRIAEIEPHAARYVVAFQKIKDGEAECEDAASFIRPAAEDKRIELSRRAAAIVDQPAFEQPDHLFEQQSVLQDQAACRSSEG